MPVAGGVAGFRPGACVRRAGSPVTIAARRTLCADAFNEAGLMRPGQWLSRALVYVDNRGVDGAVNGLGATVGGSSSRLRRIQTGFVRSYAAFILFGALIVIGYFIYYGFKLIA